MLVQYNQLLVKTVCRVHNLDWAFPLLVLSICRTQHQQKMEVTGKNQAPTNTLFVVNFDVRNTRESDIERFFDK
jgi:hypothetical protein